jgi:hypothetical protein
LISTGSCVTSESPCCPLDDVNWLFTSLILPDLAEAYSAILPLPVTLAAEKMGDSIEPPHSHALRVAPTRLAGRPAFVSCW